MVEKHFIVIGNGPAGKEAVFTLREKDPVAKITVIDKTLGTSYLPKKLPELIAGKIGDEDLHTCRIDHYKDEGIKLRCGQRVVALYPEKKEIILGHKEVIAFDGLVIAAGSRVRIPERLAPWRRHFFTLKTIQDAKRWKDAMAVVDTVLIIGADLISLAVTKVLRSMGKRVIFVINPCALWPLRYSDEKAAQVEKALIDAGVEVIKGQMVDEVEEVAEFDYRVRIDGATLEVGVIGAFYGLEPDVDFLCSSGLRIDRGILVDEHLNTGTPGIYAAGDCAQIYHPALSDYWISQGHENARILGRVAALNLATGAMREEVSPKSIFKVQGVNIDSSWKLDF